MATLGISATGAVVVYAITNRSMIQYHFGGRIFMDNEPLTINDSIGGRIHYIGFGDALVASLPRD